MAQRPLLTLDSLTYTPLLSVEIPRTDGTVIFTKLPPLKTTNRQPNANRLIVENTQNLSAYIQQTGTSLHKILTSIYKPKKPIVLHKLFLCFLIRDVHMDSANNLDFYKKCIKSICTMFYNVYVDFANNLEQIIEICINNVQMPNFKVQLQTTVLHLINSIVYRYLYTIYLYASDEESELIVNYNAVDFADPDDLKYVDEELYNFVCYHQLILSDLFNKKFMKLSSKTFQIHFDSHSGQVYDKSETDVLRKFIFTESMPNHTFIINENYCRKPIIYLKLDDGTAEENDPFNLLPRGINLYAEQSTSERHNTSQGSRRRPPSPQQPSAPPPEYFESEA